MGIDTCAHGSYCDGTFSPERLALERPIATACSRLFTFFSLLPLFNVPRLNSCIVFSTFSCAFGPYFAMIKPPLVVWIRFPSAAIRNLTDQRDDIDLI